MALNVELAFSNGTVTKDSAKPWFVSDAGVEGFITINDSTDAGFELVKISLEGVLVNSISYAEWPSRQHKDSREQQVVLRMTDIKKATDFETTMQSNENVKKCSFHFHIPQCLGHNLFGEDSGYLSDLPASISSNEYTKDMIKSPHSASGVSRVQYTVRVDVIREDAKVGLVKKQVYILPSLTPRPPICVTDFGAEYTMHCTKPIRGKGRLSSNKVGDLTIKAVEPEVVTVVRPYDPVTVCLPLKVILQPQLQESPTTRQASRDQVQLQHQSESILGGKFHCSASLISTTFISALQRTGVPTPSETEKSTTLTRNAFVCSRTKEDLTPSHHWAFNRETEGLESHMTAPLTFEHPKPDEPMIPSFDSSMVSSRYRVALKIQLRGPTRMTFNLDVPVRIRYCSRTHPDKPSLNYVSPCLDVISDFPNPLVSTQSLDRQFASLGIQDCAWEQHQQVHQQLLERHDMEFPAGHPSTVGIAAPPYVV